jgi:hypothetical protein
MVRIAVSRRGTCFIAGLFLALCCGGLPAAYAAQWQWSGIDRVVAVGDIHGAYEELLAILHQSGVIDESGRWAAGSAHLVSLGDLVDRGGRSRDIIDLFMRLETEAADAGGAVHVVLGNHEAMHLTGELEYTTDAEFAEFVDQEDPARRDEAYRNYLSRNGIPDDDGARQAFAELYPPGFFGHQAAFSPEGLYGQWILNRPVVLMLDGTLFVHGGLVDILAGEDPAAFNARMQSDLKSYAQAWQTLLRAGAVNEQAPFSERSVAAETAASARPELAPAAAALKVAEQSPIFTADGPLWYRGTAWCNPNSEALRVDRVLQHFGASRSVHGHTPTEDSRIIQRMDGRVFLVDTGMLTEVYEGSPSVFIQSGNAISALYRGEAGPRDIGTAPRRVGPRPDHLTDDQIEDILINGDIVSMEDVGEGVTKPQKVVLKKDGHEIQAIFKTESTPIQGGSRRQEQKLINLSDRWQHEVAAYRLDRLIQLDLVPVTVERTIGGASGSLSFWIDGLINELKRDEEQLTATGWCSLSEQWQLMFIFDALIYNEDRTKQNMVYGREDWMMYLIDHSRAFRTHRGRPADIRKVELRLSPLLAGRLEALEYTDLNVAMSGLLEKAQVQALLKRRDEILEDWRKGR